MTKDRVLAALWDGEIISGEALAESLAVSRTAIWKAVEELRRDGYAIESAPRRGYRLVGRSGVLSGKAVREHLAHTELRLETFKTISSTNTVLKARAEQGEAEGLVLLAEEQTAGRGRLGRSFYSPAETGLYMSLLLRPSLPARQAASLTSCAAVAVAESIEALTGENTSIKWVNDVYAGGKKVSGILTEGALDCETGRLHYAVIGIGVNLTEPRGGFPAELREIAGGVARDASAAALRCRLAAAILDKIMDFYAVLPEKPFFEAYERRCFVLGREISVLSPGAPPERATALALLPDFSLRVRFADGTERDLSSGEISVRL